MRVAFNAQYLLEPRTGTGRYVFNLLQSLGRVDGINDYTVLTPRAPKRVPDMPSTFRWQVAPVGQARRGGENIEKVFWEQVTFPRAAKQADANVMHVPHFAPPLRTRGIPTIVTIHDVINFVLPAYRTSAAVQAYGRLVQAAARSATAIVTVSEHSRHDIVQVLGLPEERVRVVPNAAEPSFRRITNPERLRQVREKYCLGERFVLNVGGLDARKNLSALIGAYAAVYHAVHDPELRLFIAGDPRLLGTSPLFPDWRPLATHFGIADSVLCAPVDEDDLPVLYSAATCFVFTSLYEGFGLTPLEAMSCGAPVVCSDRTSLPEVVGSAGILVNPEDTERLGASMQRVLTSAQQREDLRARGLARVRQFSWDQVAAEMSALYAEVTGTKRE